MSIDSQFQGRGTNPLKLKKRKKTAMETIFVFRWYTWF